MPTYHLVHCQAPLLLLLSLQISSVQVGAPVCTELHRTLPIATNLMHIPRTSRLGSYNKLVHQCL